MTISSGRSGAGSWPGPTTPTGPAGPSAEAVRRAWVP